MDTDLIPAPPSAPSEDVHSGETLAEPVTRATEMDVDGGINDEQKEPAPEPEKKDEPLSMQADDDDAVEY